MTRLRAVAAVMSRASGGEDKRGGPGDGGRPLPSTNGSNAWSALRREITRARRFGREFVLVRFELSGEGASLVSVVRPLIREIDELWVHDGSLYVLLPEANRDAGYAFVARLREVAPGELLDARAALASFPADGLTSGAILGAVRSRRARTHERTPARIPTLAERPVLHASGR
jgi:hypothetical protein